MVCLPYIKALNNTQTLHMRQYIDTPTFHKRKQISTYNKTLQCSNVNSKIKVKIGRLNIVGNELYILMIILTVPCITLDNLFFGRLYCYALYSLYVRYMLSLMNLTYKSLPSRHLKIFITIHDESSKI